MGFSDYYVHSISTPTPKAKTIETSSSSTGIKNYSIEDGIENDALLIPDQEILDSTEEIYFLENVDTGIYELNVGEISHLMTHIIAYLINSNATLISNYFLFPVHSFRRNLLIKMYSILSRWVEQCLY